MEKRVRRREGKNGWVGEGEGRGGGGDGREENMKLNSLKRGNVTYDISHRSWHRSLVSRENYHSLLILSAFLELHL